MVLATHSLCVMHLRGLCLRKLVRMCGVVGWEAPQISGMLYVEGGGVVLPSEEAEWVEWCWLSRSVSEPDN